MRPLACPRFRALGNFFVNFDVRIITTRKMGKKEALARQLSGLPESAPQGLLCTEPAIKPFTC